MGIFNLFGSKKPSEANKKRSHHYLARKFKCDAFIVKEVFIRKFTLENYSLSQAKELIPTLEKDCIDQSKKLWIHPEDTPAALLIEWTNEFITTKSHT